jgi:adenylate cyclase
MTAASAAAMDELLPGELPENAFWPDWQPPGRLAVPVRMRGRLLGVVFVEADSSRPRNFADEKTQGALANHLEAAIAAAHASAPPQAEGTQPSEGARVEDIGMRVRRIGANNSIFVNGYYLIKGVAGAVLWKLLSEYVSNGRDEFSTRELRLEPSLQLPVVNDNLGPRLILLQQRLVEHGPHLRIERTGRGRFRLLVGKPVTLVEG